METALGTRAVSGTQCRIGDVCRDYDQRWRIEGGRTGFGFRAWRRGARPARAEVTADTAAELAEQLAAAEAAI
jgi:hypothetical protein